MTIKCKCSSTSFAVMQKGKQFGLYCKECGKWQKWLSKNEINKAKIDGLQFVKEES